jgi:hypothetical protein
LKQHIASLFPTLPERAAFPPASMREDPMRDAIFTLLTFALFSAAMSVVIFVTSL